jgi:hypothetical protein
MSNAGHVAAAETADNGGRQYPRPPLPFLFGPKMLPPALIGRRNRTSIITQLQDPQPR